MRYLFFWRRQPERRVIMRAFCCVLALLLACAGVFAPKARAELSTELPQKRPANIAVSLAETAELAKRLSGAARTGGSTFCIIDATAPDAERISTDYSAASLNAKNGVVTVSAADGEILDRVIASAGLANASDAEKIAWALAWIHNNLVYDGAHSGSYVVSCFEQKGGQCNVYNGALAALLTHLGYKVRLVRGYRGNTGGQSAHWWVELLTGGEPYVFETGNREDGEWYYLAATYAETHGESRDYIKSGKYAWSGEPYSNFGAAAVASKAYLSGGGTLAGYVKKRSGCTVTETGLRVGTSPQSMKIVSSDTVSEAYGLANGGSGFSMSYSLAACGVKPAAGETLYYDFYAVADGVTVYSAVQTLAPPPEAAPSPTPAAESEKAPQSEASAKKAPPFTHPWGLTGATIITVLAAHALARRKES